jgi:3-hydroxyisobutyrate dehydrogenase-like beta-hydroxyacid dehydrogenase
MKAMRVGFIGLGKMGAGMAANLLKAGHEVTVYNRSPEKMAPLVELGANAARHVAGACGGEAVMTMLADDRAVESVAFGDGGIVASLPRGALHISSSTISVALSRRRCSAVRTSPPPGTCSSWRVARRTRCNAANRYWMRLDNGHFRCPSSRTRRTS